VILNTGVDLSAFTTTFTQSNNSTLNLEANKNVTVLIDKSSQTYDIMLHDLSDDFLNITVKFQYSPLFANILVETELSISGLSYLKPSQFSKAFD
jgi:hypothetical protein